MNAPSLFFASSLALALFTAGCGSSEGSPTGGTGGDGGAGGAGPPRILDEPIDEERSLGERRFQLYVPSGVDLNQGMAVVLSHHGATPGVSGASHLQKGVTGIVPHAQEHGYIAVLPQSRTRGTEERPVQSWESTAESPDLSFIDDILDALRDEFTIDESRIFATGMSSGGFFSYALACYRAEVIAAIGPVAGGVRLEDCATSRNVPLIAFHGTSDNAVPYDLGLESATNWSQGNGCSSETDEVFQNGDSSCNAWRGCMGTVEMCTVDEGGHTWPGGSGGAIFEAAGQGKTTLDLDATDRMWGFFEQHPKPGAGN